MNWIFASFLMFVSSVILYLLIRKSSLLETPTVFNNFAMFAIPVIIYLPFVLTSKISLKINTHQLLIIIVSAIFFSYLGNKFSLKSIEYAPNPGYSLIISKSYVVFTSIASLFLFHSTLTFKAALAIFFIVGASALIMINKNLQNISHVRASWLPLAIGAFLCWGMLALTSKYLIIIGVSIVPRLIYTMAIVSLIIVFEMNRKSIRWKILNSAQILTLLFIGIFSAGFNYFMQVGFISAPNIGYVNAINASSISAVTLFSALIFKDELTKKKLLGIVGVTIGLIILVI